MICQLLFLSITYISLTFSRCFHVDMPYYHYWTIWFFYSVLIACWQIYWPQQSSYVNELCIITEQEMWLTTLEGAIKCNLLRGYLINFWVVHYNSHMWKPARLAIHFQDQGNLSKHNKQKQGVIAYWPYAWFVPRWVKLCQAKEIYICWWRRRAVYVNCPSRQSFALVPWPLLEAGSTIDNSLSFIGTGYDADSI